MVRDAWLRRLVTAHLCSAVGEWAITVGLLVHAFRWGGASAVGVFSVTVLLWPLVCTPIVGIAMSRWRPHSIRVAAFAVQAIAYLVATVAAAAGAPTPVVAVAVVVGLIGVTGVHPTGAVLLPRIARSADDLIGAYVWVGHCDSASALLGSLAAGLLVGAGGPEAVFAVASVGAAASFAATVWRPAPLARSALPASNGPSERVLRRTLAELRARPWSRGVLAISCARNLLVGAFDVLLVVVALDVLDLGDGGPGYLSALVGGGALCSTLVVGAVVRRSRLRGALTTAVEVAALLAVVLGAWTLGPVVVVALPMVGLCMAAMDALSRTLLQRSSDPRGLGPMFAALGFVAGLGQVVGSVLAQVAMVVGGPRAAFVVLGVLLAGLAVLSVRSLRDADEHTDIPVVEMALLGGVPAFASLPATGLEQLARLAVAVDVVRGDTVVVEGQLGSDCVVISDGEFEVTVGGSRQRTLTRGDAVGEMAMLAATPRIATVTASTDGRVLRLGRDPFLVALTGFDVGGSDEVPDYGIARERFRGIVEAHDRDPRYGSVDSADSWLGLGAAGRLLGDPSFRDSLVRSASLAEVGRNDTLMAYAAAMTTWPGSFFFVAENPDFEMIELCEATLERVGEDDPTRARLLATLATHATFAYEADRREALIAEALELADRHGDPALLGAVLNAEFMCLWEPRTLDRREQIAVSLVEVAERTDDPQLEYLGGFFAAYCATERGRLAEAREQLVALRALLPRTRVEYFEFLNDRLLISIDVACGVPDVKDRIDALAERHGSTYADTDGTWALQVGVLAFQAGDLAPMMPMIEAMTEGPHARTWRAALALAQLDDDPDAARRTLADQGDVPKNYFWITVVQVQAEVVASLGMLDRCETLYAELAPYRGRVGITASGSICFGLVSRSLGELALALGRPDDAVDLLREAMADADRNAMPFEGVVCRRLLGTALAATGDEQGALAVLTDARRCAEERGFGRELRLMDAAAALR